MDFFIVYFALLTLRLSLCRKAFIPWFLYNSIYLVTKKLYQKTQHSFDFYISDRWNRSIKIFKQKQKYFEKLHVVRKNTIIPQMHAKPLNYKSKQGISVLEMLTTNDLKTMKYSTKSETNNTSWVTWTKQMDRNDFQRIQPILK